MERIYFVDYGMKELRSRLNSFIEVRNKDNFKTHFRQIALFKDEAKISGSQKNGHFSIWTHEQGRSGATGIFYPIIIGRSKVLSNGLEIVLSSKMNIIGKSVFLLILAALAYAIITGIVIQHNNEIRYLIPRIFVGAVLLGLLNSVPLFIYFRTVRILKQHIIKELGLSKNMVIAA